MKNIKSFISLLFCTIALSSCNKEDFQIYESSNYLQFVKHALDSATVSFLTTPQENSRLFPISVELVGNISDKDRVFKLGVIDTLTTAKQTNYTIPNEFIFRANRSIDTAWITINKTEEISKKPLKLVYKLLASQDFAVGQIEYSAGIVNISNVISQPDWWDDNVTYRFLGDYSEKKYRLFIEVTGVADVDTSDITVIRTYAIIFKNYLLKEKDAGRTVYEDNGTEMMVSLIGG